MIPIVRKTSGQPFGHIGGQRQPELVVAPTVRIGYSVGKLEGVDQECINAPCCGNHCVQLVLGG